MRRRGQHDDSAVRIGSEALEKCEPLLLALVRAHAGVRLVNDHEIGASPGKSLATLLGLDVIQADNRKGKCVEE